MRCPVCGATCRCKQAGPGGLCCGCHRHKGQRGLSRTGVDAWRAKHSLAPIADAQWRRQFERARTTATLPFDEASSTCGNPVEKV